MSRTGTPVGDRRLAAGLVGLALMFAGGRARADSSLSLGIIAVEDNQRYQSQQVRAQWRRETASSAQWIAARFYRYALDDYLGGVLPFRGSEPAAGVGAQWLRDLWWYAASAGFQGTPDLKGATGDVIVARAVPTDGGSTLTPRLEIAREPLGSHPLPLSLGLASDRGQFALAWKTPSTLGEAGVRLDRWEAGTFPGRVANPALDRIEPNWLGTVYGYVLRRQATWFEWGLAGRVARSTRNTLLATQVQPSYVYNWYPASAAPFVADSAVVLRARGQLASSLLATAELKLPAVSYEKRQWETVRVSYWGTAPLEAKLEATWSFLSTTALQVVGSVFDKPWNRWDFGGAGDYRTFSVQVFLTQRL